MAYRGIGEGQPLTNDASAMARVRAGREKYYLPTPPTAQSGEERIARTMKHLAAVAKRNPRVPFSTCDGRPAAKPRGVDLLFPVRLGALSSEPTLLSGPDFVPPGTPATVPGGSAAVRGGGSPLVSRACA